MRSWRRLSCTSICFSAFCVWFLSEMSPLYAPTNHRAMAAKKRMTKRTNPCMVDSVEGRPTGCAGTGRMGRAPPGICDFCHWVLMGRRLDMTESSQRLYGVVHLPSRPDEVEVRITSPATADRVRDGISEDE